MLSFPIFLFCCLTFFFQLTVFLLFLPFCKLISLFPKLYQFLLMSTMFFLLSVRMFCKLSLIFSFTIYFTLLLLSLFILLCFFCSSGHILVSIVVLIDAAVIGNFIILSETLLWYISIYFVSIFSKTLFTSRSYVKAGM